MQTQIKIPASIQQRLCCPICRSKLNLEDTEFKCTNSQCVACFPIIEGIPVLINPLANGSVFSISDFVSHTNTTFDISPKNITKQAVLRFLPSISIDIKGKSNFDKFAKLLLEQDKNPEVLVIGGSILGKEMETILSFPSIRLIETDVSFGPRTALICDVHSLPFEDRTFDGVIIQVVLEHVLDPYRCVEEIYRVLKDDGIVYAETAFMQQVHGGEYDFTRFTYLGHRRLFRKFEEIDSGAMCGPGMALAWSYQYFLLSFVTSRIGRFLARVFARLTSFWLKYFDYYLIEKPGTLDAASTYYFMGRKSKLALSDRELIKLYRNYYKPR